MILSFLSTLGLAWAMGGQDAQPRHLCDGQIDEDDAAAQHFLAQRYVGAEDQQAGHDGGPDDAQINEFPVHDATRLLVFQQA